MKKATHVITKKKRPPVTGTLIGVRVQPESLKSLDTWRKGEADLPSRPEAIRRLFELAMKKDK